MIICICNAVSDRHIRSAIADGNHTLEDLQVELGVATRCGKCRSAACDVLERELCGSACANPSLTQEITRFGHRIALIPASPSAENLVPA